VRWRRGTWRVLVVVGEGTNGSLELLDVVGMEKARGLSMQRLCHRKWINKCVA